MYYINKIELAKLG